MNIDRIIGVDGALITVAGTAVTLWQANQTKNYREQIKLDIRKIGLSRITERLKRAQDEIRKLPVLANNIPRGLNLKAIIQNIKSHFDYCISTLSSDGPDADVRTLLSQAQSNLNQYETSFGFSAINPNDVHMLQQLIQDAISTINNRIYTLEDKA